MTDNPYLQWPVFRRSVVAAFGRSLTEYQLAFEGGRVVPFTGTVRDTSLEPGASLSTLVASGPEHWLYLEVEGKGWVRVQVANSRGQISAGAVTERPEWAPVSRGASDG